MAARAKYIEGRRRSKLGKSSGKKSSPTNKPEKPRRSIRIKKMSRNTSSSQQFDSSSRSSSHTSETETSRTRKTRDSAYFSDQLHHLARSFKYSSTVVWRTMLLFKELQTRGFDLKALCLVSFAITCKLYETTFPSLESLSRYLAVKKEFLIKMESEVLELLSFKLLEITAFNKNSPLEELNMRIAKLDLSPQNKAMAESIAEFCMQFESFLELNPEEIADSSLFVVNLLQLRETPRLTDYLKRLNKVKLKGKTREILILRGETSYKRFSNLSLRYPSEQLTFVNPMLSVSDLLAQVKG